jgi:multidrug efflux system outer membrane protein
MSEVAFHYFHLLQLDAEVAIGRRATNAYAGSYRIFNERLQRGVASRLEVDRAAAALASAASLIPALELEVARTESALSLLLGTSPGPIERGTLASQTLASPQVPVGLPSDLLERRPDVLAAEQSLVAANAGIGVSVANYFPQIGLTALMGRASPELSAFTSGAGNFANLGGTLTGPIFRGGQLRAQREEAKAKFREAEANYQQTVLAAFKDVSDALATRQKLAEQRAFYLTAATHLDSSVSLAQDRYLNGKSSYYEVLQAQQELYPAQRAIAQMQAGELIAVVRLYKALGGGWSQTVTNSVPHKVEPVE